ncbi:PQQ-binding-like beta-propeller repeat protein [Haloferax sp. DFSO60]|uniref:outer membrane protein assembly factor BamB family protein n=1 Tax=Haloferax sp. DFSO60 TaxID=3388652 RepID=UPI00397A3846
MPSRRAVLSSLVASIVPFAGCGSNQPTDPHETPDARPTTTRSLPSESPTTTNTPTPEETPQDIQCDTQWEQADVWRFDTTSELAAATTDANTIYVATEREILSLDPASGEQRWRTSNDALAERFTPSRLLTTDQWVVGIGTRYIAALDRATGKRDWVFEAPGTEETASIMQEAATIVGKTLYVGVVNIDTPSFEADEPYSRLYSFDIDTGAAQLFTRFTADDSRLPVPRYLDGNRDGVFCSVDRQLIALSDDGSTRWQTGRATRGYPAPSVLDERVLASMGEKLVAFDTKTGARVWQDEELRGRVTLADGVGYATSRTIPEGDGQLTSFDPKSGAYYWEARTRGRSSTPIASDECVFLAVTSDDDAYLTAFDIERGCRLGRFSFDSGVVNAPLVGSDRVTIRTGNRQVSTLWSFAAP